jgi:hypothetical protein
VLAYGCESDRRLNIPGEDSRGVFAAREFVWWYNGHPDATQLPVDLSAVESVAVCGIGNVALDCARVLLRPLQQLAGADGGAAWLPSKADLENCIACPSPQAALSSGWSSPQQVLLALWAAGTDIAQHTMEQLRRSRVQQVHLFARRGPVQARRHYGQRGLHAWQAADWPAPCLPGRPCCGPSRLAC